MTEQSYKQRLEFIYKYKFDCAQDYIDRLKPITDSLITTIESQKEEIKRLSTCQDCGGTGTNELCHDPYYVVPCACTVDWIEEVMILNKKLIDQKAITELAVKGLEECLIGGNSLASVLIGYNLPPNWQDWSIEKASINFHSVYPLDPDMAYERYEIWLCWKTLHNHNLTLEQIERLSHE